MDPTTIPHVVSPVVSPTSASTGTLNKTKLEELMQLIPNDLDRDGWIEVGHGLKALCADDEEGFEVFDAWSQQHASLRCGQDANGMGQFRRLRAANPRRQAQSQGRAA